MRTYGSYIFLITFGYLLFSNLSAFPQTPGLIYKPASSATVGKGAYVLDPNLDGYTSATTSGFGSDDETESEIPYVPLTIVEPEPDSDLGPGPDCGFTDFVRSPGEETLYTYSDGTHLLFRFRLGGTAPNSKGYSILVDTDQAFGFSGPNADPNAVAGNPGFEVEIVLRTNFGVGVYSIDGTTSGTEIGTAETDRPYEVHAQKSIALTNICGDDDYFYDFYVAYADLPFTSSTPVRMVGNTVINPHPAMGNNGISDLGGVDDASGITDNLWEALITIFPPTSGDDLAGGAEILPRATCPKINSPIPVGATTISGTSTEADGATIEVFKDDASLGTTTVSAGTWSITGLSALMSNEEITATAEIAGTKSRSVDNCNPVLIGASCANAPTGLAIISGDKGVSGTISGLPSTSYTLTLYNEATGALPSSAQWAPSENPITVVTSAAGTATFEVNCGTGNCLDNGAYYVTAQSATACESDPSAIICSGLTGSTAPTITTSPIVTATTSLSGTSGANANVGIYIDGIASAFTGTASAGGAWTIAVSGLNIGESITAVATESGKCPATSAVTLVQEQSVAPIISGNYCTNGTVTSISGISSEDAGSTITLYSNGSSPVTTSSTVAGTTTVNPNGSWTVTGLSLSSGTFVAASVQASGELKSGLSNEVEILSQTNDASLAITTNPIIEGDASISGTGTSGNTIRLYIDDVEIESFTTVVDGSGNFTITGLDAASAGYDVLYAGGVVTVTSQSGILCESNPSAGTTIDCAPPVTQSFTASGSTADCETKSLTFDLSATENLVVYQLVDQDGNATGSSILGNGSAASLTTGALTTSMTSIAVKALRIGITCETTFGSTAITVNPLPTITLGVNPTVCQGVTTASLPYSATTNSPDQYSIDFDATAEAQGFIDVVSATLDSSPIAINVPGGAAGGVYHANLRVANSTTGCVSADNAITITVTAHNITLGTTSHPTTCGGSDGSIQLTGLSANTTYAVDYIDDGAAVATSIATDGSGNLLISGLNAGSYTDLSVTESGCTSNVISGPIDLTDPGSPAITFSTSNDPTTCGGTEGSIQLGNLAASTLYDIAYYDDGVLTTANSVSSDASGNLNIINLNDGQYTNISVTNGSGCKSNTPAGPYTLADPANPSITLGTNPDVTQGTTSADLPYSGTTGSPNQYSIDFGATAEGEGFVDVNNIALPATPINLVVPGAASVATYQAMLTVTNSATGCLSTGYAITITVSASSDNEAVYTVNPSQNVDTYNDSDVLATVSDADGTGIVSAVLVNGTSLPSGVALNATTGEITVSDASLLVADSYDFDITTTDSEGGTTTQTVSLIFESIDVAPTVSIQNAPAIVNNISPFSITIEFSEDVTGFDVNDITLTNASASNFAAVDGNTYTVDITPDGNGNITIDINAAVAQDAGGNDNTPATQAVTIFDNIAPTVDIQDEPTIVNNTNAFTVTIEFSEDVTGFDVNDITLTNASASNFNAVDGNTYTVDITPDGNGDITIDVATSVAQDAANNNNTAAIQAITAFDDAAPTVNIQNEPAIVNSTAVYSVTMEFSEDVTGFDINDISLVNASASNFVAVDGNTYTVDITPDGNGNITIDVAAAVTQDAGGNDNTAATQAVTIFDNVAPTVDIQNEPAIVNTTTAYSITIEFSEDVIGFDVSDIQVGNGATSNFAAVDGNTYTVDITPDGNGDITIDVDAAVAQDAGGNDNTAATQAVTTFDNVAPTVDIQNEPSVVNSTSIYSVIIEFSEDVTGFDINDIQVVNGSASNFIGVDGNTYTVDITPDGNGDITIDINAAVAQDAANNNNTIATQAVTIFDNVAPTVDIQGEPTIVNNTNSYSVTIEFSEDVTGFDINDITLTNASASNFVAVDGNTYTVDITPDGNGDITIDVAAAVAKDAANNNNTAAIQAITAFDNIAPMVDILGVPTIVNNTNAFTVTIEFSEDVTGFDVSDIQVGNGSASNFNAIDGNTYTVDITPNGNGDITVDVAASVAQDAGGNDNTAAAQVMTIFDNTAPEVEILEAPTTSNNTTYNVTIEFSEDVTDFEINDITLANASASNFNAVDGNTYTVDITPDGNGDITIDVAAAVAKDAANNNNTAAIQAVTAFDNEAPTVDIQGEPTIVNNTNTFSVTIEFSEDVTDFDINDVSLANASASNFTAIDGNTYTIDITPDGSGAITIDIAASVAQDAANNNNKAASQVVIGYDSDAPTVDFQGVPTIVNSNASFNITIQFSEDVTGFDINDIQVINGSTSNFIAVDDNTYTVDITPNGNGDITIDVPTAVTQDAGGSDNIAATQVLIIYDATIPSVAIQNVPAIVNNTTPFTITIEFSENVMGFDVNNIIVTHASKSNFTAVDGNTYTVDITPDGHGNITIDVAASVAQDAGGNDNTAATQAVTIYDGDAPTITIHNEPMVVGNKDPYTITIEFSKDVTGFDGSDILVAHGSISNFTIIDGSTYTIDITPDGTDDITIDIAAGAAQDNAGNNNIAITPVTTIYDDVVPTVEIQDVPELVNSSDKYTVTIKFSEDVTGLDLSDVVVGTGTASNLVAVNGHTYTVDITPNGQGDVTIEVAAGAAQDVAGNSNTDGAAQANTIYNIPAIYTILPAQSVNNYVNGQELATVNDANGNITQTTLNSNNLPAGTTLDPVSGKITISDASALIPGTYQLEIQTIDAKGGVTVHTISIVIENDNTTDVDAVYTVEPAQMASAYVNDQIVASVQDNNGSIVSAEISSGSLPSGMQMDAPSGAISVKDATLLQPGAYSFEVTTEDIHGGTTVQTVTIVILIPDSDQDGIPDELEKGTDPDNPVDTDQDGTPDYLDADSDNDGVPDAIEAGIENAQAITDLLDTDNDGIPNFQDEDDDNDGILTIKEDIDNDGNAANDDTDGDEIPDYLDADDDNDGKLTKSEYNGNDLTADDCDNDLIPDHLDPDNCGVIPDEGFSPNNDGISDAWQIKGIEDYPNNQVKVFNRWGNLIYQTKGYNNNGNAWVGQANGRLLIGDNNVPDGTYFYVVDLGDNSKPLSGYIVLKR